MLLHQKCLGFSFQFDMTLDWGRSLDEWSQCTWMLAASTLIWTFRFFWRWFRNFKKKLLFDPTKPKRERYFQNLKITSERIVSQGKIVLCPMVTLGLQQIQKTNLKIILGKSFPFFRDCAGGSKNDCPRYTAVWKGLQKKYKISFWSF